VRAANADRIIVGGDVLPGPMPHETIARLLALDIPVQFIHGNGDRVVRAQMNGEEPTEVPEQFRGIIRWTAAQLSREDEQLLASWPLTLRVQVHGLGQVLFCHATPRNDVEIFTRLTPEERLLPVFAGVDAPLVVCGHTHMQFDRKVGATRVVNAGSVGMPFQDPGAYWLLLGPGVQLRKTPYDLEKAAAQVRQTTYPNADDFAARNILQPPTEAATLEAFKSAELK
jgi:diadenosine tetraphosphatase ApaH/serine/threonine PP2A family protein phosphatase